MHPSLPPQGGEGVETWSGFRCVPFPLAGEGQGEGGSVKQNYHQRTQVRDLN